MYGSRYLMLAAALAVAVALSGCKRDYKAPEPKAQKASVVTFASRTTFAHF